MLILQVALLQTICANSLGAHRSTFTQCAVPHAQQWRTSTSPFTRAGFEHGSVFIVVEAQAIRNLVRTGVRGRRSSMDMVVSE